MCLKSFPNIYFPYGTQSITNKSFKYLIDKTTIPMTIYYFIAQRCLL